jgi:hypothetical protein
MRIKNRRRVATRRSSFGIGCPVGFTRARVGRRLQRPYAQEGTPAKRKTRWEGCFPTALVTECFSYSLR